MAKSPSLYVVNMDDVDSFSGSDSNKDGDSNAEKDDEDDSDKDGDSDPEKDDEDDSDKGDESSKDDESVEKDVSSKPHSPSSYSDELAKGMRAHKNTIKNKCMVKHVKAASKRK